MTVPPHASIIDVVPVALATLDEAETFTGRWAVRATNPCRGIVGLGPARSSPPEADGFSSIAPTLGGASPGRSSTSCESQSATPSVTNWRSDRSAVISVHL
jgi:hypothetical protein